MHYIQKHILDELREAKTMRYAKLNNISVESGHFRYHLERLIKEGYVEQLERGVYGLTLKGRHYVDKLSENSVNPSSMPKLITYTLLRDGNSVLLQQKAKQPYLGLLNMIGGKLHTGELAREAAAREVFEKTGNLIEAPKLAGIFEVIIMEDEDLLTHAIAYVFTADVKAQQYDNGLLKELTISDLEKQSGLAPDFMPIFKKINKSSGWQFDSLVIKTKSS